MNRIPQCSVSQESCSAAAPGDENSEQSRKIGVASTERRILLIGKTGVGKSTTGNTIVGEEVFRTAPFGQSVTMQCTIGQAERFGRKLLVVDTPGLFDTNKTNDAIMTEITKCYGITSPGLHAIVLVAQIGRFTEEEKKTVEFYLERFGEKVIDFLAIAFTGKAKLDQHRMTIHDFIRTLDEESSLKKLLSRTHRYVVFGLNGDINERDDEVRKLLDIIDGIIEANSGNFYTNEMYEETEKLITKRWEEEERKEKEKHQKEIEEAMKNMKIQEEKTQKEVVRSSEAEKAYQDQLEKMERELTEKRRKREEEYRNKIRMEMESGKGIFYTVCDTVGRLLRGIFSW